MRQVSRLSFLSGRQKARDLIGTYTQRGLWVSSVIYLASIHNYSIITITLRNYSIWSLAQLSGYRWEILINLVDLVNLLSLKPMDNLDIFKKHSRRYVH